LLEATEKRLLLARAGHEMVSTRYSKEAQWKRFEALVRRRFRRQMMSDSFIPISKPFIGAREKELVLDALNSGWVSSIGKIHRGVRKELRALLWEPNTPSQ